MKKKTVHKKLVNIKVKLSAIYAMVYVVNDIKINTFGVIQNVLLGNIATTVCRTAVRIVTQQRLVTERLVSVTADVLQDGNHLFVMKVHIFFKVHQLSVACFCLRIMIFFKILICLNILTISFSDFFYTLDLSDFIFFYLITSFDIVVKKGNKKARKSLQ